MGCGGRPGDQGSRWLRIPFTWRGPSEAFHLFELQLSKDVEKKLELKESPDKGVYVKDLIQFVAKGPSELNNVLKVREAICVH